MHKKFQHLPTMRPIVSQSSSLLSPSAQFIDHVLQPLANIYADYIPNSTALILRLQDLVVPDDATVDVTNIYPSIPQSECLNMSVMPYSCAEICRWPVVIILSEKSLTFVPIEGIQVNVMETDPSSSTLPTPQCMGCRMALWTGGVIYLCKLGRPQQFGMYIYAMSDGGYVISGWRKGAGLGRGFTEIA